MMIGCVNLTNKVLFVRSDGKLTECSEYAAPATPELRQKMVVKNPKIAWNLYDFIPQWNAEPVLTCVGAGFGAGGGSDHIIIIDV